jgi:hypothetical protein
MRDLKAASKTATRLLVKMSIPIEFVSYLSIPESAPYHRSDPEF